MVEAVPSPHLLINPASPKGPHLFITEAALKRLDVLFEQEKQADTKAEPRLEIRVDAGGCSGFQYHLDVVAHANNDNLLLSYQAPLLSIDEASLDLIKDSIIDFRQDLMGSSFVIRNPHAASSCGCGNSFSMF